ncbi:MAG: hypothetical protein J6Q32_04285 [Clostridia bacterium]|nr:hypothetical protein [Clostridia bacterium]
MGFLSAMKGANNVWGTIICADGVGTIGPENFIKNTDHNLMITIGFRTFTFSKNDVQNIKIIASTSEWVKYLILLKNGKSYVAIFMMTAPAQTKKKSLTASDNGKKINMAVQNFEWWMFDLIYTNQSIINTESVSISNSQTKNFNNDKSKLTPTKTINQQQKTMASEFWTCKKCGGKNRSISIFCKDCGAYK